MNNKTNKTNQQWREQLSEQQYYVTREKGTERAFTGEYYNCNESGVYTCVCCGAGLFDSSAKYDSGSGWPSYYQPITSKCVRLKDDKTLLMQRTEVICDQCEAHLGHVFDDGPAPTGKRFCINSAALKLKKS